MPPTETPLFSCAHTFAVAAAAVLAALCSAPEGFEDDFGFHTLTGNWEPETVRAASPAPAPHI